MQTLRIIVPVFNDWRSFNILLRELDRVAASQTVRFRVTAINDGSTEEPHAYLNALSELTSLEQIEIVHLAVNVGHQRAIAVGLCIAVEDDAEDAVLIMDADGEDAPEAILKLQQQAAERDRFCIVAQRAKRSEGLTFRLSYLAYKFAFQLLTAKRIDFGNFSLLSRSYARRLVRVPDLWNNLPAAILRSKLTIEPVPVDRARRYAGKSTMNFTSLVVHGLSGISVYAETIFVRLFLLTLFLAGLTGMAIAAVLLLRLRFPSYATPGWATTVSFGMVILLMQTLSVTLSSVLMLLNNRVQRLVIPILDYKMYIDFREPLYMREPLYRSKAAAMGMDGRDK